MRKGLAPTLGAPAAWDCHSDLAVAKRPGNRWNTGYGYKSSVRTRSRKSRSGVRAAWCLCGETPHLPSHCTSLLMVNVAPLSPSAALEDRAASPPPARSTWAETNTCHTRREDVASPAGNQLLLASLILWSFDFGQGQPRFAQLYLHFKHFIVLAMYYTRQHGQTGKLYTCP